MVSNAVEVVVTRRTPRTPRSISAIRKDTGCRSSIAIASSLLRGNVLAAEIEMSSTTETQWTGRTVTRTERIISLISHQCLHRCGAHAKSVPTGGRTTPSASFAQEQLQAIVGLSSSIRDHRR